MKKSLIILPMAALLLTGCAIGGGSASTSRRRKTPTVTTTTGVPSTSADPSSTTSTSVPTEKPTSASTKTPSTPSVSTPSGPVEMAPLGDKIVQGYERLDTAPENDKDYIYGLYQANLDQYNFLNGFHHTDENGEYPYYLSTTTDVTKAVTVRCHYVDETHFTIQIIGGGEFDHYDGKYLKLYEGTKSGGTKIESLEAGDDSSAVWYFLDEYTDDDGLIYTLNTNVMDVKFTRDGTVPVTMGSYEEYETFSACKPYHFQSNFLSHLYQKVE